MANKDRSIQRFTVQESMNLLLPRLVVVEATQVADDNADDDVAFDWVKIPNASALPGHPTKLVTASIYDHGVGLAIMDIIFCRGSGDDGTAPTAAQGLLDGAGVGSAAVDITSAEGQAIKICGMMRMSGHESELGLSNLLTKFGSAELIMAPATNSRDLYVGGIWRSEPADNSGAATTMDIYLGFEG